MTERYEITFPPGYALAWLATIEREGEEIGGRGPSSRDEQSVYRYDASSVRDMKEPLPMPTDDRPQPARTYLDEHGRYREGQGRPEPPMGASETATLLGFLERQRATLAWKTGGLDAIGLRATLGTSSMTLGGVLKHLARFEDDMSTEWLYGREQLPPWNAIDWDTDHDWDWRSAAEDAPEQLYARWTDAVARCRALMEEALTDPTNGAAARLRYILPNMIEEYARHNGHADLIRESVDALVGHDPPE